MSKAQRWEWAFCLKLEELDEQHLQSAYKLNWDNLCKFDSCRKNCKRILCLACFDRTWVESDSSANNNNNFDNFDTTNCELKRTDLKSFVGLKNLGATCYVNCLLQLWFHNPALRKAIYGWEKGNNNHDSWENGANNNNNNCSNNTTTKDTQDTNESRNKIEVKIDDVLDSSKTNHKPKIEEATTNAKKSQTSSDQNSKAVVPADSSLLSTLPSTSQGQNHSASNPVQTNPIEQLQLIFARLQFTNKKSIDPFNFIDSLALNATEQQDAQEFGNLFMEFLEKSFANQDNTFVSNIIQNQFCGRYSYATICDHCKNSSLSDSNFYELDLSIQNLETLHDCLNEFFRPVPLDGKYNCSHCRKAQSARRKIILKSLPPTLNLQLLRFIYDKQRNVRQKLNSYIIFPEILDMNCYLKSGHAKSNASLSGMSGENYNSYMQNGISKQNQKSSIYLLSAVLIHRGSSPHSGHYIAHIRDRITKDWYKFNDDSVERIGPQLQVSTEGESITIVEDKTETIKYHDQKSGKMVKLESKSLKSKTAYMLVYQAQDNEALSYPSDHSEKWILPDHLQCAVAEENSKSDQMFESLQIAREVDQQVMAVRRAQIRNIYEKLVCRDPTDRFEFIEKSWLQNWLTNSSSRAKFPPIDNSHLLCIHDKLDFRKTDLVKCVRSEGADLLYKEYGGGPRLQDAMCRKCVALEVELIQLKERLKEDQKYITSQSKFKLDADYDFADAYIVGKKSYRDWQNLVMVKFEKSHPEMVNQKRDLSNQPSSDEDEAKGTSNEKQLAKRVDADESGHESDEDSIDKFVFNSDILCEHSQLIHDTTAWRIVPKEVWMIFKHYFGNDPDCPLIERNANTIMCADCKKQEVEQQEIGDIQKQKALEQKSKLPDLFHNRKRASWCSMLPEDQYYALDRQFLTKWQKFIRNPCNQEQPTAAKNRDKLICEHGRLLYNHQNSNPILPECPFVLISEYELNVLRQYYDIDKEIRFSIDPELASEKLQLYLSSQKSSSPSKKSANHQESLPNPKQLDQSGDHNGGYPASISESSTQQSNSAASQQEPRPIVEGDIDYTDVDWSECVISDPDFCSECYELLRQDELKKLLNYESATIYITRVENTNAHGPHNNTNGSSLPSLDNCDNEGQNKQSEVRSDANVQGDHGTDPEVSILEQHPHKRRKKIYTEDEANDFVPPGVNKQQPLPSPPINSALRRTSRRNRNREQAYTIKPTQTLLQLKKEIFARCQVLPVDQRLFLDDTLLDDSTKTMLELRIVPNCSLKLEVDKPVNDSTDLIEDEQASRKLSAQPETGFKGSLLLSNSHL